MIVFIAILFLLLVSVGIALSRTGNRRWVGNYLISTSSRRMPGVEQPVHLFFCIADHFEPNWAKASPDRAMERVEHWVRQYPISFRDFRDADGRPPQHTFFYPMEAYKEREVEALVTLCRQGFGEIEIHLHHGHDTAATLLTKLNSYVDWLATRHDLLGIDRLTGRRAYGFIHGNWALNDALRRPELCGVEDEIRILRETGCYADFTFPAFPSAAQPAMVNSIYYATNVRGRAAMDSGADVRVGGAAPSNSLMMIQGPLLADWARRRWVMAPRMENGCLQANQPPHIRRLLLWLRARVQVCGRPDWFFVKLHTHGAQERNYHALLEEPMIQFHRELADFSRANRNFQIHYVTARQLYNLARAAEAGWSGSVGAATEFAVIRPSAVAQEPCSVDRGVVATANLA